MKSNYQYEQIFKNKDYTTVPLEKGEYECCVFSNCHFSGSDLSEIRFIETEFIDCDWSNVKLEKTALQEVQFKRCKLLGLYFDHCKTFGFAATFIDCQLNHSSFYQMDLTKVSFQDCQLEEVDFTEANLEGVSMQNCDLLNATFEHTNLQNADLSNSRNYMIDPELNRIKGARFSLPDVVGLLRKYGIKVE